MRSRDSKPECADIRRSLTTLPEQPCPDEVTRRIVQATSLDVVPGTSRLVSRWTGWIFNWRPATAAAVLAALLVLIVHPPGEWQEEDTPTYSAEEIQLARQQVKLTLAYTAQMIQQSEQKALNEILGTRMPRIIRNSLYKTFAQSEGGQG